MPAPHLEPRTHSRATQQGMGCPWPPVGRRARWQTQWLCWQTPQAQMSSMTKVSQQASTPSSQGEEPSAPLGKLNNSQRPRQGLYGMKLQSVLQKSQQCAYSIRRPLRCGAQKLDLVLRALPNGTQLHAAPPALAATLTQPYSTPPSPNLIQLHLAIALASLDSPSLPTPPNPTQPHLVPPCFLG